MSITNDWRNQLAKYHENGEALEVLAETLPPDIPWVIKPDYIYPMLEWSVKDETPQAFAARVRRVAGHMKSDAHISSEVYGDSPTLTARWYGPDGISEWAIVVEGRRTSCRTDPRTSYRPARQVEPHPECKAMLEGLREEVADILEGVTPCTK